MQADAGAQAVQIFDSWASNLAPQDYDIFAGPYINQIVDSVKQTHPDLPLILYISGSGGLLERMAKCNVEVISVDGSVDMKDAIRRIGPKFAVQVLSCLFLSGVHSGVVSTGMPSRYTVPRCAVFKCQMLVLAITNQNQLHGTSSIIRNALQEGVHDQTRSLPIASGVWVLCRPTCLSLHRMLQCLSRIQL